VAGKTLASTNFYNIKNMARHKYFAEKTKGVFSSSQNTNLANKFTIHVAAYFRLYDYREVVWTASFKKKSATIDGEAVSYYVLDFEYSEPDEVALKRVDQAVAVLESDEDMQKLFDPALEAATQCVDGLKPEAIAQLVENLRAHRAALQASIRG
jgi:hypothetical protein